MVELIADDGTIGWKCPLGCGLQTVHVTHEGVRWVESNYVQLPPCKGCGAQTSVHIYSEEEKTAPNAITMGMVPQERMLPHAVTGEPIPVMIPELMPVGVNPAIARHQALKNLLEQHGKSYQPPLQGGVEEGGQIDANNQ